MVIKLLISQAQLKKSVELFFANNQIKTQPFLENEQSPDIEGALLITDCFSRVKKISKLSKSHVILVGDLINPLEVINLLNSSSINQFFYWPNQQQNLLEAINNHILASKISDQAELFFDDIDSTTGLLNKFGFQKLLDNIINLEKNKINFKLITINVKNYHKLIELNGNDVYYNYIRNTIEHLHQHINKNFLICSLDKGAFICIVPAEDSNKIISDVFQTFCLEFNKQNLKPCINLDYKDTNL